MLHKQYYEIQLQAVKVGAFLCTYMASTSVHRCSIDILLELQKYH